VALAELRDRTQLLSLLLATRFRKTPSSPLESRASLQRVRVVKEQAIPRNRHIEIYTTAKGFPPSRIAVSWVCATGISAENEALVTTIDGIANKAIARGLIGFSAALAVIFRPEDGVTYCIECACIRTRVHSLRMLLASAEISSSVFNLYP
jgi:hypothetical protein